ncbi:MAG: hypothetical protein OCU18_03820 [Candidatus Syntrophoarchaeum sp.]|nr:hypothetical protein [Candidatus Syntrophoarchaeum sp.]
MDNENTVKMFVEALDCIAFANKKGLIDVSPYEKKILIDHDVFDRLFPAELHDRKRSISGRYIRKEVEIDGGIKFAALFDVENYIDVENIDEKF